MSTVLRKRLSRGWTGIPNSTIRDRALSFRATGVLAFLLSMEDGWSFDARIIAERKGHEARDAVRSAFNELKAAGYMRQTKHRGQRGRIHTEVEVSDVAVPDWASAALTSVAGVTGDGFSGAGATDAGPPEPGRPDAGQPTAKAEDPRRNPEDGASSSNARAHAPSTGDPDDDVLLEAFRLLAEDRLESRVEASWKIGPVVDPSRWMATDIEHSWQERRDDALEYLDDHPEASPREIADHLWDLACGEVA